MAPPRKPPAEAPPDSNDRDEDLADEIEADAAERESYTAHDAALDALGVDRKRLQAVVDELTARNAVLAEEPTVIEALSAVMGDVQSVSKTQRNTSQNYNFRGIDAVVNAVGPALREHGVVVVPINVEGEVEHYQTKTGTAMKNVTLTITFRFYGPAGDFIDATARGEAADSGDKATPKAHSVAFRTCLLQALCIPTDEIDPDAESHERAAQPFEGSSGTEPRARERRQSDGYEHPKNWTELAGRMANLVGDEEAVEWMKQAGQVATGNHVPISEMSQDEQRVAWKVLTDTLRDLSGLGEDLQLHANPRETIQEAFAVHLDGQVLAGPSWALTGTEAEGDYPAKDSVLADEEKLAESESAEDVPTDEEQQSLADEIAAEAAAAAARDE